MVRQWRRAIICVVAVCAVGCTARFNDAKTDRTVGTIALGQPDLVSDLNYSRGLRIPEGVLYLGGKLYVSDTGNNRILIWNTLPTSAATPPDLVLGQPDLTTVERGTAANRLSGPHAIHSDGTRLFVADEQNHRVLIWSSLPTRNQQPADVVVGQTNMDAGSVNCNGSPSAKCLYFPDKAVTDGTRLIVADRYNHRVLIWNTIPTTNNVAADLVLGQPSFSSNVPNAGGVVSAHTLNYPYHVWTEGGKLFVADAYNFRVLIWNTIPTTTQADADTVVGQAAFNTRNSALTQSGLDHVGDVTTSGANLIVSDPYQNRVLIWNPIPTAPGAVAASVLGQADYFSATVSPTGVTAGSLSFPLAAHSDGTHFFVADTFNNRLLIWNQFPSGIQPPANLALGQPTLNLNQANNPGTSAGTLGKPFGAMTDGARIFVADSLNNRVLIWSSLPRHSGAGADVVLGQPDTSSVQVNAGGGASAFTLSGPLGVFSDGTRLWVADSGNNRILIWNQIPTSNQAPADLVIGQPDFASNGANTGGIGAASLSAPSAIAADGAQLVVTDQGNNRVLIWKNLPTVSHAPADIALGQTSFSTGDVNQGGLASDSFQGPYGVSTRDHQLYVADSGNHRVLVWRTIPTAMKQAADLVLGQPDFFSDTPNYEGVSARTLKNPMHAFSDGGKLYVADTGNHRVLVWNALPSASSQPADSVLGQPDLGSARLNYSGLNANGLNQPTHLEIRGGVTLISDTVNNRVLVQMPASQILGNPEGVVTRVVGWLGRLFRSGK